ncbi:MAG: VOC family protein [Kiloniellales bacterium]
MTTKAIPDGFFTVTAHLTVEGAAEAIEFYKQAFGAVELGRMAMPDGERLMHAMIRIGDSPVMLVDALEAFGSKDPKGLGGTPVTLNLYVEDAKAAFDKAVAAGCAVTMPLEERFWGDLYGRLTDPFGHSWAICQHVRDVSPDEMKKAAAAAFGG